MAHLPVRVRPLAPLEGNGSVHPFTPTGGSLGLGRDARGELERLELLLIETSRVLISAVIGRVDPDTESPPAGFGLSICQLHAARQAAGRRDAAAIAFAETDTCARAACPTYIPASRADTLRTSESRSTQRCRIGASPRRKTSASFMPAYACGEILGLARRRRREMAGKAMGSGEGSGARRVLWMGSNADMPEPSKSCRVLARALPSRPSS